jgi:L-amino acid N-acyltransferase YncA
MIRRAEIKDLDRIVAIYNQTIPLRYVTADTESVSVESRIDWFHQFNDQRPLWVYELEGVVQAWCSLKSFYGRPAYNSTVEIGIYIDEQNRQHGLGSKLLLHAISEAKPLGIQTLLAFIFANNIGSIHFFKKNGFIEFGLLPSVAYIDNKPIDLAILGYKLV